MRFRHLRPVLALGALAAAVACSPSAPPADPAAVAARAAALSPTDARLADLYASACRACHAQRGSGAPLAGDRSAWEPRWRKGLPALVKSTVVGLNGMPAGGQCFACTPDDYRALIRFMADREGDG